MITLNKYLILLIILGIWACSSNDEINTQKIIIEDGMNYYGKEFNQKGVVSLKEFVVLAENTDTLDIKLKIGISEVCQSMGCWMKVNLIDGAKMIVSFKEHKLLIPKDVAGKTCIINGRTFLRSISADMQKQYAKDLGDKSEAVDTIIAPIVQRFFIANGIIIKE